MERRRKRTIRLLEYVALNPGCRRMSIQAHMKSLHKKTLNPKLISDYLGTLIMTKVVVENDGRFFVTEEGKKFLEQSRNEPDLP